MKKVYIDLLIAVICIFLILKFPILFLLLAIVIGIVWFMILDDKKKNQIKNKIAEFYR